MPNEPVIGPVILNNTPLVALWSIGQLVLLRDLYGEVFIPPTILEEFVAVEPEIRKADLAEAPWIKIAPLANPHQVLAYVGLDQGEAEVLALASEQSARLVIIDERKGRRYAQRLGLPLSGTLGVLLTAKTQGLIQAVAPLIYQLKTEGLFLSPELIEKAIELAGENTPN